MTEIIRVLYVDDEQTLLDLCKVFLERSGNFIVTTTTGAPEALRILELSKFDAIVSDYQMPEMDGIEFLKVIRARGDKTPFIIFTGKGREEVVIEALNAGADFYIQKGGEPKSQFAELAHKVLRAVQHRIDERALHTQTNLLISMINSSAEFVIFSLDREYRYLTFNEKHREEMQRVWKADIRIGMNILDCMTDTVLRKAAQESIDRALRGDAFTEVQRQPDPDIWYEFNWNPIRQRTGDVMGVSVFIRDITQRKLTDEKIKTSEMRYRRLFESAKDGILILNKDTGEIIDANPFIENLLGYTPHELIGKHLWDIGLFKDQLGSKIAFEELQAKKYIRYEDLPLETKDGRRIDVEFVSNVYPVNSTSVIQCNIRDITERKKAAQALKINYARLDSTMEAGNLAWWEMDCQTGAVVFSEKKAQMLGYSPDYFSHYTDFTALLHPDDLEPAMQAMRDHLNSTAPVYDIEYRIRTSTGEYRWFHDTGRITEYNPDKTPKKVTGLVLDITERKQAELEIRRLLANVSQEKDRLSSLINSISDEVWFADTEGRFTLANPKALQEFRLDGADGINVETLATSVEVLRPDGSPRPVEEAPPLRALAGQVVRLQDEIVRTPATGELRYRQVSAAPVRDAKGTIIGSISVVRDITDQKKAEQSLREATLRWQSTFDSTQDAICIVDADQRIVTCNRMMQELVGAKNTEELVGRYCWEVVHRTTGPIPGCPLVQMRHSRTRQQLELKIDDHWFVVTVDPVLDNAGKLVGAVHNIRDITDRKQIEVTLAESEEKFRILAESCPFAIAIYQGDYWVYTNPAGEQISGYSADDLYTMHYWDFVAPEFQSFVKEAGRKRQTREPIPKSYDFRIITKDGSEKWVALSANPITFMGRPAGLITVIDITIRKQAAEALRESEEKLKSLYKILPVGVTILDKNRNVVDTNPALEQILALSKERLLKGDHQQRRHTRGDGTLMPPEEYASSRAIAGQTVVSGVETGVVKEDGSIIWTSVSAAPLGDDEQNTVIVTTDITERKHAEEMLRKSEEQYRTLAANLPEIVYRVYLKEHGRMQFFNDQVAALTGYTEPELTQGTVCSIEPLIHPDDRERVVAAVEKAITEHGIFAVEYRLLHKDGSIRSFNERGRIIYGDDHEPHYIDGIIHDITEQKALHDAISLANKKLNLLASITRHDIVNQLLALNGYLELSRDILHDPVKLEEFITKQQNIARTIEAQIRFTKDYQDLGVKAPEWQNVHESVVKAKESLSLRGIAVETDCPTLEVFADPLIAKVFYNLMDNAVRHGGAQMKTIRFSGAECGSDYCIICEDDGIGIPAKEKDKIFERGYGKNTGLGLFLVREILSITGITITETGAQGKGARFEITVPKEAYRFKGEEIK